MTGQSLTEELVQSIRKREIDRADHEKAALFALDAAANMVAGCNSVPGTKFLNWAAPRGLLGHNCSDFSARSFLLGALCHILEVDDLHRASVVHPGCVVLPVVFAYGARQDGLAALDALLHGFEATTRLGMAVGPAHYRLWHNTATCGSFGSAMAAARLLGLGDEAAAHALGNAGTQAAGLWQFIETGAESKHLHAAHAAQCGAQAAELAEYGLTGAPQILEGDRGFFAAMCEDGDPKRMRDDPHAPWQVHLTSIKPWPSCRHTHPAIDAALEIGSELRARGADGSAIQSAEVQAYQAALNLCDRAVVDTDYEAKFSLQHCVAAALSLDTVAFDAFGADARDTLAPLRQKIGVGCSDVYESAYPVHWGSEVCVELADGTVLSAARTDAKGDPETPLDGQGMIDKARDLMRHGGLADPDPLIQGIHDMADGGPVPDIVAAVSQCAESQIDPAHRLAGE